MKLLDLLLENVEIPFKKSCTLTITNSNGEEITVDCEVPSNEEEKMTGLMYRDELCDSCGMFYDYVDGGFWMKNVNFPIEMVFINGDEIVDIKKALPNDETTIYPSVESDGNLEVNDGFCESNNISVGNKVYRS
jgi:uncharacterized membrane protein (UPF0127 family)